MYLFEIVRTCPPVTNPLQITSFIIVRVSILGYIFELVRLILLFWLAKFSTESLFETNARTLAYFSYVVYGLGLTKETSIGYE